MQGYLPEYELNPATWAYLSSLLIIGIFFKFHRFWSVRNFDLLVLIFLAPGLLSIAKHDPSGYVWLFSVGALFLVRLLLDPLMVRRPLLEPNLNASGLTFTGLAIMVFLMGNVILGKVPELAQLAPAGGDRAALEQCPLLYRLADLSDQNQSAEALPAAPQEPKQQWLRVAVVRILAVVAHLAVVLAIVLIGLWHFDNLHTGVAMASLYLLLPYTAQVTPRIDHVVPAALVIWAVAAYRHPGVAGLLLGSAAALIGYPLFLLPLWCGYYWRRGLIRFVVGVIAGLLVAVLLTVLVLAVLRTLGVEQIGSVGQRLAQLLAWARLGLVESGGFWETRVQAFRIPVIAGFVALCFSFALWPPQKNFGTLLSSSAAVMLAVQFWHPYHGGLYVAWYLPLLVATIFRPNLEDRVAVNAVSEGWFPWRTRVWLAAWWEDWAPGSAGRQFSRPTNGGK